MGQMDHPLISGFIYFTIAMILLGVGKAYYTRYQAQQSPAPSAPAYTIHMENPGQHRGMNEQSLTFSAPSHQGRLLQETWLRPHLCFLASPSFPHQGSLNIGRDIKLDFAIIFPFKTMSFIPLMNRFHYTLS